MASPHSASAHGSCALAVQPLYVRRYIDHDIDQSRRPRHTRHRHTAAVLWLFSLSTVGFTLITTLINQDGLATSASAYGSCALAIQPLYSRLYIDHVIDQSRRPRQTRHRHTAAVLWWFSLSTFGFTLITTLINHDGLATLGIGIRQLCFGCSASLRSALH